jgi:hypothetical protein
MFILISIFFASLAQAQTRPECYEQIKAFNKKFSTMEVVFADMKNEGDWLFVRVKAGHKLDNAEMAGMNSLGRTCIKAGFSYNTVMGEMGNDMPKKLCQVQNAETLAMVCSPYSAFKPVVVRLK